MEMKLNAMMVRAAVRAPLLTPLDMDVLAQTKCVALTGLVQTTVQPFHDPATLVILLELHVSGQHAPQDRFVVQMENVRQPGMRILYARLHGTVTLRNLSVVLMVCAVIILLMVVQIN